jgi:FkbM family methyltransferase
LKNPLTTLVQKFPPLYRQINRIRKLRLHEPTLRRGYRVYGSSYGGWAVPDDYLSAGSVLYSVGVGTDISFDRAVLECYACQLFAFDPTPNAVTFMQESRLPEGLTFLPIGLSAHDGTEKFFPPKTDGFDSFSQSSTDSDSVAAAITCEVLTFASLKRRLGHDAVDLLKMDIEGFEYGVIQQILASTMPTPGCLLIEFHHGMYGILPEKTTDAVESLLHRGYEIFWISPIGREYGFLLNKSD